MVSGGDREAHVGEEEVEGVIVQFYERLFKEEAEWRPSLGG